MTAVGYHAVGDGALALDPVGTQANAGVFTRLLRRLFGEDKGRHPLLPDGWQRRGRDRRPRHRRTARNGRLRACRRHRDRHLAAMVAGEQHGVRIDIQPSGSPGLVVSLQNLEPDPALSVGSTVAAARTKIGALIDLSEVETSALAEFTQDRGTPRAHGGASSRPSLCRKRRFRRLLFVADVFGVPGRRAIESRLPELRHELDVDFCIVNGENAADGAGLTAKLAERLLERGADVVTTGNHVWRQRDLYPLLVERAGAPPGELRRAGGPGRGACVALARDGTPVAVLNLMGGLFMDSPLTRSRSPRSSSRSCGARHRSWSSTSTPRRRARRSRSRACSTAKGLP